MEGSQQCFGERAEKQGNRMSKETDVADPKRRVTALETESFGQQRFNVRSLEMLTELREDVAILRRHAVATGQKVDSVEVQLTKLRNDLPDIIAAAVAPLLGKEGL
jgi:hypothetical protein